MAGKSFSGIIDTAMGDVFKENLLHAVSVLEENGITGLIEPISPIAVPNYFMNSFHQGNRVEQLVHSWKLHSLPHNTTY